MYLEFIVGLKQRKWTEANHIHLPGSQEREHFDEQSTGNLQLQSFHGQAVFEREILIKEFSVDVANNNSKHSRNRSMRVEVGQLPLHIF